jgi:single-strand DNA-binding protein
MKSINSITVAGRIVADPELKTLPSGSSVCTFAIAVQDDFKERKQSYFFECLAWSHSGEAIARYFHKGDLIFLVGELIQERWEKDGAKQSKVKIKVTNFNFGSQKKESSEPQTEKVQTFPVTSDDLPF